MTGDSNSNGAGERPILKRLKLSGFKSIREMDLELGRLNVLIGGNGAGKSNLLSFLRLVGSADPMPIQESAIAEGGARSLLRYGPEVTQWIEVDLEFAKGDIQRSASWRLMYKPPDDLRIVRGILPMAPEGEQDSPFMPHPTYWWGVYHFNDTSPTARVHAQCYLHDNHELGANAHNLSAYLYMLREMHRPYYDRIVATIRLMVPSFGDFVLEPLELNPNNILLQWRGREGDYLFGSHQLSDGTLRIAALCTLLLQPEDRLPSLIVIDEPELGLHPYALEVIVSLLESVSTHTQVIVATQSVGLVDRVGPSTIVVVDRHEGASVFRRLAPDELDEWLDDYSLGELWEKNVIGGRPAR